MLRVTQIMSSFLALKILTSASIAIKHNGLKSVALEEFKRSLTLLVPPMCISCAWVLQKSGSVDLWSLS